MKILYYAHYIHNCARSPSPSVTKSCTSTLVHFQVLETAQNVFKSVGRMPLFGLKCSLGKIGVVKVGVGEQRISIPLHSLRYHSVNAKSIVNKLVQLKAVFETENLDVLAVMDSFL